jgi:group I intron endonuclease
MKENKTNCGIYGIKNIKNNNYYIGSSENLKSRKYDHFNLLENNKHVNPHLQSSYNKYGKENFEWKVIKYVEKIDNKAGLKEELLKWENFYIEDYKNKGIILYNIRNKAESNLGIKHTLEQNKEKSKRQKGRKLTKEWKENISKSNKGKKRTEEVKQKYSIIHKGKKLSEETKYKISNIHKGKNLSEEHKEKIKEFNKGKKLSEEHKEKISKALKGNKNNLGRKMTEELRLTLRNKVQKSVTNLDTLLTFSSIKEASLFYSVNIGNICEVCKGNRKTAGGYRWSYEDTL